MDTMLKAANQSQLDRRRGQALGIMAAAAWSTAGILQRQLTLSAATQIVGRAVFALAVLLAYVLTTHRGRLRTVLQSAFAAPSIMLAVSLAVASGLFVLALNHTTVAHVLIIQALTPLIAAILGASVLHEPISKRTWMAVCAAVAGVAVMVGIPGQHSLAGEVMALGTPVAFAIAIVITRRHREISMAPATCLSQALLIVSVAPLANSTVHARALVWLSLLGVVQLGLGLIFFTIGARLISAAEMALISMLEVVLGPLWVWIGLQERPNVATVVGGAIVLLAVIAQVRSTVPSASAHMAERVTERRPAWKRPSCHL